MAIPDRFVTQERQGETVAGVLSERKMVAGPAALEMIQRVVDGIRRERKTIGLASKNVDGGCEAAF